MCSAIKVLPMTVSFVPEYYYMNLYDAVTHRTLNMPP